MKKHIIQQGTVDVKCHREFIVETKDDDALDDERLVELGDEADVEWMFDQDKATVTVEGSEVKDFDPGKEYDCPEIIYGGSVEVKGVFINGKPLQQDSSRSDDHTGSVDIILTDPPYAQEHDDE